MADWNDYVEKSGGDLEAASRAYKNDVPLDEFEPSGSGSPGGDDLLGVSVGRESAHFGSQEPGDDAHPGAKTGTVKELACGDQLKVPAGQDPQAALEDHIEGDCDDPSAHEGRNAQGAHGNREPNGHADGSQKGGDGS